MEDKIDYGSILEYIEYLDSFKKTSKISSGYFYTYHYNFHKHYPIEELKFYDWRPLSFVFSIVNEDKPYFYGLNFHHLPVKARQWWLRKVKSAASSYFEQGGIRRIPGLNYNTLQKIMKKGLFGVRKYRFEAVKELRIIRLEDLDEIMKFYGRTYYGVTIKQIQARYSKFRPK
jgi:hypothetical protein